MVGVLQCFVWVLGFTIILGWCSNTNVVIIIKNVAVPVVFLSSNVSEKGNHMHNITGLINKLHVGRQMKGRQNSQLTKKGAKRS